VAKQPNEDRDDALKAWLQANGLVGDFARGGCSSATFRIYWQRNWVPGFDPPIFDWWQDYPDKAGENALEVLGFTKQEIATEKAKPPKRTKG
jgi:hypothetical protein